MTPKMTTLSATHLDIEQYSIDRSKPVLVTGGTGYLAGVLIKELLHRGLTVHTTVRDISNKSKYQYLQDLAATVAAINTKTAAAGGGDGSNKGNGTINFFQANLLEKGSFKHAMEGCSVVFHTASPFKFDFVDPQTELIEPAIFGTENVLNQANETPTVTRVVLTSSSLAVHGDACESGATTHASTSTRNDNGTKTAAKYLTEESWNRTASLTHQQYALSKTLAEQRAWIIAGSQTQWKLVVMNPGFLLGPGLRYHESSESNQFIKRLGSNDPTMIAGCPNLGFSTIDVRDAAIAHVRGGFLPDNAVNGRYLLNNNPDGYTMPQLGKLLGEVYTPKGYPIVTKASPLPKLIFWLLGPYIKKGLTRKWIWNNINHVPHLDNTKCMKQLGMEYEKLTPMQDTLCDMYQLLINEGIVTSNRK